MVRVALIENGQEVPEVGQLAYDLDEAQAQLRAVGRTAQIVEECRAEVATLKRQLNEAKARLQQAEWNVVAVARAINDRNKRRAGR